MRLWCVDRSRDIVDTFATRRAKTIVTHDSRPIRYVTSGSGFIVARLPFHALRHVRFRFPSKSTREFRYVTSSGGFWRDRPPYFRSTGYVTSGSGCCRNRLPTSARPTPRSHPLPVLSNSTPASPPDYGPGRDVISVSGSCRIRRRLSRTGQATGCRIQVPGDPYRPATRHRQHTVPVCSQSPRPDTAACDVFAPASQRQVSKQIHGVTVTTEFRHFVGMT